MSKGRHLPSFQLLRFFSIASFLSTLIVALAIVFFFRYMAINAINGLSAELNTSIARSALATVEESVEQILVRHSRLPLNERIGAMPDSSLVKDIDGIVDGSGIVRVKLYSREGTVIYSTNREQIGRKQDANPGFYGAMRGEIANKLVYHDQLNPFDQEKSDDNLFQTYLPLISTESQRPIGVFEIYSDANDIVRRAEREQLIVIPVVFGALGALYLILITIVRNSQTTIDQQQKVILDRTQTLELLSAKLLNAQEQERKKLAEILHEDVAQTLSAIKRCLENPTRHGDTKPSAPLLGLIQDAIVQIREFSIDLRPSALDDFGVIDALNTLFREIRSSHGNLTLDWGIEIQESDLPKPLSTIIFRIAKDTLRSLTGETEADKVQIILTRVKDQIQLTIEENAYGYSAATSQASPDDATNPATMLMRERTILSGGEFTAAATTDGMTRNIAVWPI